MESRDNAPTLIDEAYIEVLTICTVYILGTYVGLSISGARAKST